MPHSFPTRPSSFSFEFPGQYFSPFYQIPWQYPECKCLASFQRCRIQSHHAIPYCIIDAIGMKIFYDSDNCIPVVIHSFTDRITPSEPLHSRSEEHTSELQSLMRHSYDDFCL